MFPLRWYRKDSRFYDPDVAAIAFREGGCLPFGNAFVMISTRARRGIKKDCCSTRAGKATTAPPGCDAFTPPLSVSFNCLVIYVPASVPFLLWLANASRGEFCLFCSPHGDTEPNSDAVPKLM
ncbi:MAG: hypothetical protein DME55_13070 [Verrucomicrobia bacterium]|nr:MAG: hypothetical protein DME55_13070 [Verrucomicrobiota bacterium]